MSELPETMTVDLPRLIPLRAEAASLVLQAAVLVVTWNSVGSLLTDCPAVKSQLTEQVSVLMSDSSVMEEVDKLTVVAESVVAKLRASLPVEMLDQKESVFSVLNAQIVDLCRSENPIRKLIGNFLHIPKRKHQISE